MELKTVRVISNYLVFDCPPQVASMFYNAKYSEPVCGIPFTLENAIILRNFGYNAPSPIRSQYNWPLRRGRTPRWYQVDTAEFFTLHKRCFCLNAMRTGKTNAALWAADFLKKQGYVRKILIVAPLSTLELVWGNYIYTDICYRKYAIVYGSREQRIKALNQDVDFYIINHDGIDVVQKELIAKKDIDLIIFDECAKYRNKETDRWERTKEITKPHQWLWGLTGTPTPNEPTDAYGQVKLIKPENIEGSFKHFKNQVMVRLDIYNWIPAKENEQIVHRVMQPSIRFTRAVCTEMEPSLIERTCELSTEQKEHYKKLMREASTIVNGTQITAVNAGVLMSKLIQTACGVAYGMNGEVARMDFGPRLRVLEELIEENNEKVLVFVPFTGVLDALAEKLRKRWSVEIIDGRVSAGKRKSIFERFQRDKDPHVILAHPGCMAHGLDLTAASLIIWYAPHTKNEEVEQANARIDGALQRVKMDIAEISATAEERRIYKGIREKSSAQKIILGLMEK